jgi:hypothetical protein
MGNYGSSFQTGFEMAGERKIQRFMLWDEPRPRLSDFVSFSPAQLDAFSSFIDRYGFDVALKETLELASILGVSHERALDLLRYAELLDDQKSQFKLTPEDVVEEFRTYLERKGTPQLLERLPTLASSLRDLFKERPDVRLSSKRRTVSGGIVPRALTFDSLCDLRPVFNEPRDKILDYSSIALIRIRTESDRQESNDLIFQIDSDGLRLLEQFMERLRKKFEVIEETRRRLLEQKP